MGRISTAIAANTKNNIINGAFDIWQRTASLSVTANVITYTADRWAAYSLDNALTIARITATSGIQGFGLKLQRNAGQTGTNSVNIAQSAESINSVPLAGKTITLTFRAKAGANLSSSGLSVSSRISTGTGTDQNRLNGFTGQVDFTQVNTLTTSFQTFTQTVTLAAGINQFAVVFFYVPTGTAGADDSVTIEQVSLTEGSTPPPFSRFGKDIEGELAACLRYYERLGDNFMLVNRQYAGAITSYRLSGIWRATKRAAPTTTKVGTWSVVNSAQPVVDGSTTTGWLLINSVPATGVYEYITDSANDYLEASAEL